MTPPAAPIPADLADLELDEKIIRLKQERNAVLLAHYYQESEIQDVADFIGDSLQLAQKAKATDREVILFAGVHFMAETAKILNPDRVVVVPDLAAGCSLADSCPVDKFVAWKARHPDAVTISYINCSAAVKAESDYICTSSNAVKVVRAMPEDRPILFAPDRNLGRFVMKQTGRELVLWPGTCHVHETFSRKKLVGLRHTHPSAKVIAHPGHVFPDFIGGETQDRCDPARHGLEHVVHRALAGTPCTRIGLRRVLTVLDDVKIKAAQCLRTEIMDFLHRNVKLIVVVVLL